MRKTCPHCNGAKIVWSMAGGRLGAPAYETTVRCGVCKTAGYLRRDLTGRWVPGYPAKINLGYCSAMPRH